jgi:hypothetical protein
MRRYHPTGWVDVYWLTLSGEWSHAYSLYYPERFYR